VTARIVEEPTAAALAYGLQPRRCGPYFACTTRGGTLDVSLRNVSDGFVIVMAVRHDRLGGKGLDAAVAHFLLEHRGRGSYGT
jgi:molecular chaperone DnaK